MCVVVIGSLALMLTGCKASISNSTIDISASDLTGVKEKEIHLNDGINELSMDGKISLKSGSVELYIKSIDTDKILFSETYNADDSGNISIDMDDLDSNIDLVLGINSSNAKNFSLHLESQQKLVRDKEKRDPEEHGIPSN